MNSLLQMAIFNRTEKLKRMAAHDEVVILLDAAVIASVTTQTPRFLGMTFLHWN